MLMAEVEQRRERIFHALLVGFGGQLAGRLLDLQWHLTHDDFEGGLDQLQAHWAHFLLLVSNIAGAVGVVWVVVARHVSRRARAVA